MIPLIVILLALNQPKHWFVHSELSDFQNPRADVQSPKISPAEMWVRLQEEGQPWHEPPILKGNSTADRLRHDPE